MQKIYLAKPGAQKEGPYTIEQINHDLASKKISDTDFWAWHEGLPAWTPLYSVPGVSAKAWVVAVPEARPERPAVKPAPDHHAVQIRPESITAKTETARAPAPVAKSQPPIQKPETNGTTTIKPELVKSTVRVVSDPVVAPEPRTAKADEHSALEATSQSRASRDEVLTAPMIKPVVEKPEVELQVARSVEPESANPEAKDVAETPPEADTPTLEPQPKPSELLATPSMSSGKPFAALDQVFIFTTGEGPSAFKSEVTVAMLAEAVGRTLGEIRAKIPVDVIGGTAPSVVEVIRRGSIPASTWRALFKIKHTVAQQIQDGAYHLCVRTFPVESKDLVALFLLYNKQKL